MPPLPHSPGPDSPGPDSSPMVRAAGLGKNFAGSPVLDGIDLVVARGAFAAVIGPSGSGKSTLLRCLDAFTLPDRGVLEVAGQDLRAPGFDKRALRRRVGMVFQALNLFPHKTVLQNVAIGPRLALGWTQAESESRALALLERLQMADKAGRYPGELSAGQTQRAMLARALVMEPELLLLDEATSALDRRSMRTVAELVSGLVRDDGLTCIAASHDLDFVRLVADEVYYLDHARIVESGPPADLLDKPRESETRAFLDHVA